MAKFFETSEFLQEIVEKEFDKLNMDVFGVTYKVMSTKKSKELIKVSKANPTAEYLSGTEDVVIIQVYEEALERLTTEMIHQIIEMGLVGVFYDAEKGKLNVENNIVKAIFAMRKKYGEEFINTLESGYLAIEQIADEGKEK